MIFSRRGAADGGARRSFSPRLIIAVIIAAISLIGYFGRSVVNPVTGKNQHISLTPEQEVAIGLQAAPEMAQQFGGLDPDRKSQDLVDAVGAKIIAALPESAIDYPFDFHVLADRQTVNAFALPGGQVFITSALFSRLETEGQLAGVLAHEVGHVVGRHSAERIAKSELMQGLVGAVGVGASDSADGGRGAAQIASLVADFTTLKYGREDELESDRLGLGFMVDSGYDPRSMIRVMQILEAASGGSSQPEFASTHPNPGNRIKHIEDALAEKYPQGPPSGLKP
jgi:predicted Zn-dependent protease